MHDKKCKLFTLTYTQIYAKMYTLTFVKDKLRGCSMYNLNDVNNSDAYFVDYTEELIDTDSFAYAMYVMKARKRQPTTASHHKLVDVLATLKRDGKLTPGE